MLYAATFIETIATGLNYALLPFFLVRSAGVSAPGVGVTMSIAGVAGLLAGYLLGHAADRMGPQWVIVSAYGGQAAASAALPFARAYQFLVFVICVSVFAKEGGRAVRYALIARMGEDNPVGFRARIQVVSNVGVALGAVLGGTAAQLDSRNVYAAAYLACAACFALAAALQALLFRFSPAHRKPGQGARPGRLADVLHDRPYLSVSGLNMLLTVQTQVIVLAIPLWIITTHATPAWTVSAVLLVNTAVVALFQVRAVHGIATPLDAGYSWRRAGSLFLLACAITPLTLIIHGWGAIAVIIVAVAVHSLGETLHAAGMFQLALGLAPGNAMGAYQGIFNLGEGLAAVFAPALVTFLCITWRAPGWLLLGILLLLPGMAAPALTRWAQRGLQAAPVGEVDARQA